MAFKHLLIMGAVWIMLVLLPRPVNATEIWGINEWRVKLPREQGLPLEMAWPKQLKVQTENQFSDQGYQQFLLRLGPVWQVTDWLDLAAYSSIVHAAGTQNLYREISWELEPTIKGEIASLSWSNRNRLAYRVFLNETGWRYRNRTKLEHPLFWPDWNLFASDEIFIDPQAQELVQNRLAIGVSHQMDTIYGWSLAWQNRALKKDHSWLFENGIVFTLIMS